MNKLKTISLCGVLAASMAASALAGCGQTDGTKTAIVVNDDEINLGTAAFFLRYQQAETSATMQSYGLGTTGNGFWSEEYTASSSGGTVTYGESMKETAQQTLVEAVVLNQHADEYKVKIPDELATSIDSVAEDTYNSNKDAMDKIGTTEADIKKVLELSTIQRLIFYPMVEDTDTNVSDDDAARSTITYARIALTKYDSSTGQTNEVSDDDKATYKSELESLLQQVKDSGDVASADMTTMANNLDNKNIACTTYSFGKDDTVMPDEVLTAARSLKDGEIYDGVIDTGDYYYLVRMDSVHDADATEQAKQSIISDRQQQNYQKKLDAWVKASKVEVKSAWKNLKVTDMDNYVAKQNTSGVVSESTFASDSSSSSGSSASSSSSVGTVSTSAG